jgi:lipoprotein-anchoring transpeptidase ErfK/SrfK
LAPPQLTARLTTSAASSSPATIPKPIAQISTVPAASAADVSPIEPVTIRVSNGALDAVRVTNPEGRAVKGTLSPDKTGWRSAEPLGYGRSYSIVATATNLDGMKSKSASTFTTLEPQDTAYPSFFPNPTMKTIGVGQPMVVSFDKTPTDRAAVEKALTVTTVPAVKGAWFWWDDKTLHYRAETYWKPGTEITVQANVYGIDLGDGLYGETDRTLKLTVGPSKVAKIEDATKQMKVYVDGKLARTIPVSMGRNQQITVGGTDISFVTPSGTYVVQEKYEVKRMSSATYGLPTSYELGYDKDIPLAVRLSAGGIFVHSAPWSVDDQGERNVSHGCINISPQHAKWFYDNFSYGDIVTVTGTSTSLEPTDGYGDWNIPWDEWKQGSALA